MSAPAAGSGGRGAAASPPTVLPAMRVLLWAGAALTGATFVQLYVLTPHTARDFAWTVANPLSAATIGAFYGAASVLAVGVAVQRYWHRAVVGVPGVVVFLWLTLLATLLHLGQFHLHAPGAAARVAAWAWLVIYLADPPALTVAWIAQRLTRRGKPPPVVPLPSGVELAVAVVGGALLAGGLLMFAQPSLVAGGWGWTLTPLVTQVLAAWVAGLGGVLVTVAVTGRTRAAPVTLALAVLGVLLLGAAARFPHRLETHRVTGWAWLAGAGALLVAGLVLLPPARRAARAEPGAATAPDR